MRVSKSTENVNMLLTCQGHYCSCVRSHMHVASRQARRAQRTACTVHANSTFGRDNQVARSRSTQRTIARVHWISRVHRGLKSGQVDTAQPVDGSGSHGWCGVALLWLHDSVLGVNVASPGGARMSVAPQRSGLAYVCGATNTPKVRRHADVRHTLVLGLLGHGSLCVCVTHWVGVRMCGCSVSGWCGCVRMAVRAAVTHIAGHCGTKCLACCHCPHRWPPPRPL